MNRPDIERAGAIVLAPHDQRLGFHFEQIEIKILGAGRAMLGKRDQFRIVARFEALLDQIPR